MPFRLDTSIPPLLAAALVVAAGGCGSDDDGRAGTPPLLRAVPGSPATAPDRGARDLHVPSVRGLSVSAARLRVGVRRFRVEEGRRFVVASQNAMLARMDPAGAEGRTVVGQLPRHPDPAAPGDVVVFGTTPAADPGHGRPHLQEVPWTTIRWAAGVLVLDGLRLTRSCDRIDHVQVGPRDGTVRTVRVWISTLPVPPRGGCPRRTPQAVLLRPGPDWTRDTVAWNGPLAPTRTDLRGVRPVRFAGITVQPDARTVMVGVPNGGCEVPAGASIVVRGRIATVDARVGTSPRPADAGPGPRLCPQDRRRSTVMVRLPRPLPFGARFVARD